MNSHTLGQALSFLLEQGETKCKVNKARLIDEVKVRFHLTDKELGLAVDAIENITSCSSEKNIKIENPSLYISPNQL